MLVMQVRACVSGGGGALVGCVQWCWGKERNVYCVAQWKGIEHLHFTAWNVGQKREERDLLDNSMERATYNSMRTFERVEHEKLVT